jgi:tetratricopeptide (TPR) repeat protein
MEQVEKLMEQTAKRKEEYKTTPQFKAVTTKDDERLSQTTESILPRAVLLNRKAWHLAEYGIDLDKAESASRESLQIIAHSSQQDHTLSDADFKDTLAYILMQIGKIDDALGIWAAVLGNARTAVAEKEWIFRYAVALSARGRTDEAIKALITAIDEKKYYPSHELYLLRPYINAPPFATRLDELMKKNQSSPLSISARCQTGATSR